MAFEQFLNQKQERRTSTRKRSITYALSLSLHGVVLVGLLVRSFWYVEELQPKNVSITLALRMPPPPPPPPPAAAAKRPDPPKVAEVIRPKRDKLVQPAPPKVKEAPPPAAEEPAEAGDETGEAGGTPGGVAGGVATAAPPAPLPPPPPPRPIELAPVMLPPAIGSGQRLSDLNDPRFRPTLPPPLNRAGIVIWGLFRICVGANGRVKDVKVLKSADQLVDSNWSAIIARWEYRPYSIEGRAVPFCHAARIEVRAQL